MPVSSQLNARFQYLELISIMLTGTMRRQELSKRFYPWAHAYKCSRVRGHSSLHAFVQARIGDSFMATECAANPPALRVPRTQRLPIMWNYPLLLRAMQAYDDRGY